MGNENVSNEFQGEVSQTYIDISGDNNGVTISTTYFLPGHYVSLLLNACRL